MIGPEALDAEMARADRWPEGMGTFTTVAALQRGADAALAAIEALGELTGARLARELAVIEGVVEIMGYTSVGLSDFPAGTTPAPLCTYLNLERAFALGRQVAEEDRDLGEPTQQDWEDAMDAADAAVPSERARLLSAVEGMSLQKLPVPFVDVFAQALAFGYYEPMETIGCLQELVRVRASARALGHGYRLALPDAGRMVDLHLSPTTCVDELRRVMGAGTQ